MDFAAWPSQWTVTLSSGARLRILADSVVEKERVLQFCVHLDASEAEWRRLPVTERVSSRPDRVGVCVAEIPRDAIEEVAGEQTYPSEL